MSFKNNTFSAFSVSVVKCVKNKCGRQVLSEDMYISKENRWNWQY